LYKKNRHVTSVFDLQGPLTWTEASTSCSFTVTPTQMTELAELGIITIVTTDDPAFLVGEIRFADCAQFNSLHIEQLAQDFRMFIACFYISLTYLLVTRTQPTWSFCVVPGWWRDKGIDTMQNARSNRA
jgi:hypothetical protein